MFSHGRNPRRNRSRGQHQSRRQDRSRKRGRSSGSRVVLQRRREFKNIPPRQRQFRWRGGKVIGITSVFPQLVNVQSPDQEQVGGIVHGGKLGGFPGGLHG